MLSVLSGIGGGAVRAATAIATAVVSITAALGVADSAPRLALAVSIAVALGVASSAPRLALGASAGPQPAMTGVPAIGSEAAEGTCVSCHTSFALNPDTAGAVTLEGVPAGYEPGRSYKLTVRVAHSEKSLLRWGFQMTAVSMKDGAGAGEFVVADSATTQVLSAMSGTRSYVEHSYGGTAIGQAGGASWSFDWKAPATDVGKVGFFVAGNAANADGSNQGDRVYSHSPLPIAETNGSAAAAASPEPPPAAASPEPPPAAASPEPPPAAASPDASHAPSSEVPHVTSD